MGKRQNLQRLSITLMLILALAVGLLFATGLDFNVNRGNDVIEGGGSSYSGSPAFRDMPAIDSSFVVVNSGASTGAKEPADGVIRTAGEFYYVFTKKAEELNKKSFTLGADFVVMDATYLYNDFLSIKEGITLDGAGHTVVSDYVTGLEKISNNTKNNFGGLFSYVDGTLRNLNFYLAPTAALNIIQMEQDGGTGNRASVDVTMGGFAGRVGGTIENCNINIYGSIYGVRGGSRNVGATSGYWRPRIGGAFGAMEGTLKNNVINVIGATVSAGNHGTRNANDGYRTLGGVSGILRIHADKFNGDMTGNVFNVSPSTIIGADLMGAYSNHKESSYNEAGIYFGNVGGSQAANMGGNYFINYNDLYKWGGYAKGNGSTYDVANYKMPYVIGYTDGFRLLDGKQNLIDTYGASLFGDDFKYTAHSDGNITLSVNSRSLTGINGSENTPSHTNNFISKGLASNNIEFYDGVTTDTISTYKVNDTYSWNRLVSISGTAYFTNNIMSDETATVLDSMANMGVNPNNDKDPNKDDKATKKTRFETLRKTVELDTAANGGEFAFTADAAPAFALYADITGNNGTNPENNVVDISEMIKSSGLIRKFAEGSISNVTIRNLPNKSTRDGGAVYKYVGGIIDDVAKGVTITNSIIENRFDYDKVNSSDASIITGSNCSGDMFVGGIFGRVGGTLEKVNIKSIVNITLNSIIRPGKSNMGRMNAIFVGGLAGQTDGGINIKQSIINTDMSVEAAPQIMHGGETNQNILLKEKGNFYAGGLLAQSRGDVSITNSLISSQLRNAKTTVHKPADNDGDKKLYQAKIAGLVAHNNGAVTTNNARIDIQISASETVSPNVDKAYLFETATGAIKMDNTFINLNNMYNWGVGNRAIMSNSAPSFTSSNTWLYNVNRYDDFTNQKYLNDVNTISTVGYTKQHRSGKIVIRSILGLTVDQLAPRPSSDVSQYPFCTDPSDPNYQFDDACSAPEFYAEASNAFYDGNLSTRVNEDYQAPNSVKEFTDAAIEKQDLGWFQGTKLDLTTKNTINSGFTASVKAVLNKSAVDANGNKVIDYFDYSIKSTKAAASSKNQHVIALLSTKAIKNSVDWNQVAMNVNNGLSPTWMEATVVADISGGIYPMGTDVAHAFNGNINGAVDVLDANGKKTGTRNAKITAGIAPVGSIPTAGIFGYVGAEGVVRGFDVATTLPTIAAPANGDVKLGLVAGHNSGRIENVSVELTSSVSLENYNVNGNLYLGLVAGYNDGIIDSVNVNVYNQLFLKHNEDRNYTGNNYIGGAVGYNKGSVWNTAVNLGKLQISATSGQTFVAGGIAYNEIAESQINDEAKKPIYGLYISANSSNFVSGGGSSVAYATHFQNANMEYAANGIMLGYYDYYGFRKFPIYTFDRNPGDKIIKSVQVTGEDLNCQRANITFDVVYGNIKNDTVNPSDRNVVIKVDNGGTSAVAGFSGYPRPLGTDNSAYKNLTTSTEYTLAFTADEFTAGIDPADNNRTVADLRIRLVSNEIGNASDWGNFALAVNEGATFENNRFIINPDDGLDYLELTGSVNSVAIGGSSFNGILSGNGKKIVLNNADPMNSALIGKLGATGIVENLTVEVKGILNVVASHAAVLVADNNGTIDNVNIIINNDRQTKNIFSGEGADNVSGLLVAVNNGVIDNVNINANIDTNNNSACLIIHGNKAGMIAGINGAGGKISNVSSVTKYVMVAGNDASSDPSNNLGLMVGRMENGAMMNTVVNTVKTTYDNNSDGNYFISTKYFVGSFDDSIKKKNINNVWMLYDAEGYSADRISGAANGNKIFNVMFKNNLDNRIKDKKDDYSRISAGINSGSVIFESYTASGHEVPFYGYVSLSDGKFAKDIVYTAKYSSDGKGVNGNIYASIFAKRNIDSVEDLQNLQHYTKQDAFVNGLNFQVTRDIVLTKAPYDNDKNKNINKMVWDTIPYLNHNIIGNNHTVRTDISTGGKVTADTIFTGFFGEILEGGGIKQLNIEMAANIGRSAEGSGLVDVAVTVPDKAALIAMNGNAGTISNVKVTLNGMVTAIKAAGIITSNNTGTIEDSEITLNYDIGLNAGANAKITPTSIWSESAGVVAGINSGNIKSSVVNLGAETSIKGQNVGGIAGQNKDTAIILGSAVIDNNITNATATSNDKKMVLAGQLVGKEVGGIAGINDGIIANMIVDINAWYASESTQTDFGGVTSVNNGYIGYVIVNMNKDTTPANLLNVAGVAVDSNGYIGSTVVNINAPMVAKSHAAGLAVTTNGVANALDTGNGVNDVAINVNAPIKATESGAVAAGFVIENSVAVEGIIIKIKSVISADNGSASVIGITQNAPTGTAVRTDYTVDGGISKSMDALSNKDFIVIDYVRPISKHGNVYGTFETVNGGTFTDSWFIKNNYFTLPLGGAGFNEFKGVTPKEIMVTRSDYAEEADVVTSRPGKLVSIAVSKSDGSFLSENNVKMIDGEMTEDTSIKRIVFTPNSDSTNRTLVFSDFKLSIENITDFMELNKLMDNLDLFYDITITLEADIVIDSAKKIVPFGNLNDFNAIFDGKKHKITVNTNIGGDSSGLFGTIGAAGAVKDLIVEIGNNVKIGSSTSKYAGGLAGDVYGTISNVAVSIVNSANADNLAVIETAERIDSRRGAFAGYIDGTANIANAWVILQNGRYPTANNEDNSALPVNRVNLGGVDKLDAISFNADTNAIVVTIPMEYAKEGAWKDVTAESKSLTLITIDDNENKNAYILPVDKTGNIYNVSLINNAIGTADEFLDFVKNQNGFSINEHEQFKLTADIKITPADLLKAYGEETFFSIGTRELPFKSKFNGQGHRITLTNTNADASVGNMVIKDKSATNQVAGLFGVIAETAFIDNLKINIEVNNFVATYFVGGFAGSNESDNLTNIVVRYDAPAPTLTAGAKFGGIFGENNATTLSGVLLVKDIQTDIKPVGNFNDYNNANVIDIYGPENKKFDVNLNVDENKLTFEHTENAGVSDPAPFYGVINTSSNEWNKNTEFIDNISVLKNQHFAAVFVKSDISTEDDVFNMNYVLSDRDTSGAPKVSYNIRWLEFKFTKAIEITKGFDGYAIAHDEKNALKATINGDGNTLSIHDMRFYGINAGIFGTIASDGVIKNLIVEVHDSAFGRAPTAEEAKDPNYKIPTTKNAGVITGLNYGTIENVVVKNLITDGADGHKFSGVTIYGSEMASAVVGKNVQGKINNVWLVQPNTNESVVVDPAVNVIEIAGSARGTTVKVDNNIVSISPSNRVGVDAFIYPMSDMTKAYAKPIVSTLGGGVTDFAGTTDKGNRFLFTDFDLVINTEEEYNKFLAVFNSDGCTPLNDVMISIEGYKGEPVEGEEEGVLTIKNNITPLGTATKPFEGIINGIVNGKSGKINVTSNVAINAADNYAGLFGNLGKDAVIRDLEIYMNGQVIGKPVKNSKDNTYENTYVGVIAYNAGTIENVVIDVNSTAKFSVVTEDKTYNVANNKIGAIAITEHGVTNVWLVKATDIDLAPSVTYNIRAGINVLTMVGTIDHTIKVPVKKPTPSEGVQTTIAPEEPTPDPEPSQPQVTYEDKVVQYEIGVDIVKGAEGTEIVFTTPMNEELPVGEFYRNFKVSSKPISTNEKPSFTAKMMRGEVYEWVNHTGIIANAKDWERLAVDTRSGYPFDGKQFVVTGDFEIKATANNSLGAFNGSIVDVADTIDAAANTITVIDNEVVDQETTIENMKDFVLIGEIGTSGKVSGITVNFNANIPFTADSMRERALIINVNNGVIDGVKVVINSDITNKVTGTDGAVTHISTANVGSFVGVNNKTIKNVTISVAGVMEVSQSFGHVAVENKGTISNVALTLNGSKVVANSAGAFGLVVGNNLEKSSINGINVVVNNSYLAGASDANNYVGGFVGYNKGSVLNGYIEFDTAPIVYDGYDKKDTVDERFYLRGKSASFFAGKNNFEVDNVVAKAIKNDDMNVETPGKTNEHHYVYATSAGNDYDYNGGNDGGNVWIVVDDADSIYDATVEVKSANIIKVMGNAKDITVKHDTAPYTFTAVPDGEDNPLSQFNGWFNSDNSIATVAKGDREFKPAQGIMGRRFDVVFLSTSISNVADWNEFTRIVNSGKDISNVTYMLADDIELTGKITPVGTKYNPFIGNFNGQDHTITVSGTINADMAGIFGNIKDANIYGVKVVVGADATITGKDAAGALVGKAENSVIGKAPKAVNPDALTISVTNNGTITADNAVGGVVGNMIGETLSNVLANTMVINNGDIKYSILTKASVGGAIGEDTNTTINRVTVVNNKLIEGFLAGGLVGSHKSGEMIDYAQIISDTPTSVIIGTQAGGGLAGRSNSSIDHGYVRYVGEGNTSALGYFVSQNTVILNTWVVTTVGTNIMNHAVNDNSTLRVLRANKDTVANIVTDKTKEQTEDTVVFTTKFVENKYDYWTNTDANLGSVYAVGEKNQVAPFMKANGIAKTAKGSFDITLEQRNAIDSVDQLRALSLWSAKTANDTTGARTAYTFKLTSDIAINEAVTVDMNALDTINGNIDGKFSMITLGNADVYFNNGTIDSVIFALDGELIAEDPVLNGQTSEATPDGKALTKVTLSNAPEANLTLNNVKFADGKVYRNISDIPAKIEEVQKGGYKQFLKFGSIELNVKAGVAGYSIVSRNKGMTGENVTHIYGNVPLLANMDVIDFPMLEGYGDFVTVKKANDFYIFEKYIREINLGKALNEMEYLMNIGYDFVGQIIEVESDIRVLSGKKSLGSGEATFNGTFDGNGHTITYQENYSPLFNKIGATGAITNFVVNISIEGGKGIFQATDAVSGSKISNIVIINDNKDIDYTEIAGTSNYDNVLVIQGKKGANTAYTNVYQLIVDTTVGGTFVPSQLVTVTPVYLENNNFDTFNVTMKKSAGNNMFVGYYTAGEALIDAYANGITTKDMDTVLTTNHSITAKVLGNTIASAVDWDAMQKNINDASTKNDEIVLGGDIVLEDATTALGSTKASATFNGANKKITLPAGATNPVFDGYTGKVQNVIIDASATTKTLAEILANTGATEFSNVFVITKKTVVSASEVSLAGESVIPVGVVNIIVEEGITPTIVGTVITFTHDNNFYLHIFDNEGNVVERADYDKLDVSLGAVGSEFSVTKQTTVADENQLKSLSMSTDAVSVSITGDINITKDIALSNNVTINANGHYINLDKGVTMTLGGANIKNAIIDGLGTVAITGGTVKNTLIIAKNAIDAELPVETFENVWANTERKIANANVYSIDLTMAYDSVGAKTYSVNVANGDTVAEFTIVMNAENDGNYFSGLYQRGTAVDFSDDVEVAATTGLEYKLGALTDFSKFVYAKSYIDSEAYYDFIVSKVNINDNLNGKTFTLKNDVVIENALSAITGEKNITLDLADKTLTINKLYAADLDKVDIQNGIVEILDADANVTKFAANIVNDVVVVTYLDNLEIANHAVDAKYHTIKVNRFGSENIDFTRAGDTVFINVASISGFRARKRGTTTAADKLSITQLLAGTEVETIVDFYVPVNVSLYGSSNKELLNTIIDGFTEEVLFVGAKSYTLDLNVEENIILNGYTVNGIPNKANYSANVEYDVTTAGTAVKIELNVTQLGTSINRVKNKVSEYRVDPATGAYTVEAINYDNIGNITDIAPSYSLPSYLDYALDKSLDKKLVSSNPDTYETATLGEAGRYKRSIKVFVKGQPDSVVGHIVYTHVITPYKFKQADLTTVTREYKDNDLSTTLETKTSFFDTLPKAVQDALIANLKLEFLDDYACNYTLDVNGNKVYNGKYVGIISNTTEIANINAADANFEIDKNTSFRGIISQREVVITLDSTKVDASVFDFANVVFKHNQTGNNVFSAIGYDEIIKMSTVGGVSVDNDVTTKPKSDDIGKVDQTLPYFYIANGGKMLDVGVYQIASNIDDSRNFTYKVIVGTEDSIEVNKTAYTINIKNNDVLIANKYYLATVNPNNKYFIAEVEGADNSSLTVDINYIMWNEITKVVGESRVFYAEPGVKHTIIGDALSMTLKFGSQVIDSKNYDITNVTPAGTIEGGEFVIDKMPVAKNIELKSSKAIFTGAVPNLKATVNHKSFETAGLYAKAVFDEGNVIDAGTHGVNIKLYAAALGDIDVTKYVNIDGLDSINGLVINKNEAGEAVSFSGSFEILKANPIIRYKNATATYTDAPLAIANFLDIVNPVIAGLFAKGGIFADAKFTVVEDKTDGVAVTYDDKINAGKYIIKLDLTLPENARIAKNLDLTLSSTGARLTINKLVVDAVLTMNSDTTITYGDKFMGHSLVFKNGENVVEVPITYSYVDENIVVGETIFNAGDVKFDKNSIKFTENDNYTIKNITIDSLKVDKKAVNVTLESGTKVSKYFGQAGNVDSTLNNKLVVEGIVGNDKVTGVYQYADVVGKQNVTLMNIRSDNYVMANDPVTYTGILTVNKAKFDLEVSKVDVDEKNNTTTVKLSGKLNGKKVSKLPTIVLDGTNYDKESVNAAVMSYMTTNGYGEDSYAITLKNNVEFKVKEFQTYMNIVFMAIVALMILVAAIMLISSIVAMNTMPTGFNKDFNFSRDNGKNDTANLMKAVGKRRDTEYKNVSKQLEKAAKKGSYFNVEQSLFPEPQEDEFDNVFGDEKEEDKPVDKKQAKKDAKAAKKAAKEAAKLETETDAEPAVDADENKDEE